MKNPLNNLLKNKMALNIITILSLLSIISYIFLGKIEYVFLYLLLATILFYFSKNLLIVLGIPFIMVNGFYIIRKGRPIYEGMENNTNVLKDDKIKEIKKAVNKKKQSMKSNGGALHMTPVDENIDDMTETADDSGVNSNESFEVGRSKKGKYSVDYAATIEDAYDELNTILGSDGVKRLTDDTQRLMKQQMKLAESMSNMEPILQGMGPLLKQAQGLLGSMNDSGNSLGNVADMAKKLNTNAAQK